MQINQRQINKRSSLLTHAAHTHQTTMRYSKRWLQLEAYITSSQNHRFAETWQDTEGVGLVQGAHCLPSSQPWTWPRRGHWGSSFLRSVCFPSGKSSGKASSHSSCPCRLGSCLYYGTCHTIHLFYNNLYWDIIHMSGTFTHLKCTDQWYESLIPELVLVCHWLLLTPCW